MMARKRHGELGRRNAHDVAAQCRDVYTARVIMNTLCNFTPTQGSEGRTMSTP